MNKWQCPVCKAGKVAVVGESLVCLACGCQEYLYDYRNAYDDPMPPPQAETSDLADRVGNLEAILSP